MSAVPIETISEAPRHRRAGPADVALDRSWLHVCNGLDPRRDGGMVPSILGMTAALSRLREGVTIVTPTPSRIDPTSLAEGLSLEGPETNLDEAVRAAEVVHLHGLWQAQTRRGARSARSARVPYLIAAHGMAEPWALRHKYWKKRIYLAVLESRNLRVRHACTPSPGPRSATFVPLLRGRRSATSPMASTSHSPRIRPHAPSWRRITRSFAGNSCCSSSGDSTSRRVSTCWRRPSAGSPEIVLTSICCSPATTAGPGPRSATEWSSSAWPRG